MAHPRRSAVRSGTLYGVRFAVAALLLVAPAVLAAALVTATSSPSDANVGGGLYVIGGVLAGVGLAAFYLRRARR